MSSCTRPGIKARYNYNRTLKDINVNKLFILDDFGVDLRDAYYLGYDGNFEIEEAVKELISNIKSTLNIQKVIYAGSSKGGYAALYFGLSDFDSNIIIGAPQYYLGNYLSKVHPHILQYVMGNKDSESINVLNELLPQKIRKINNSNRNNIFLQYSNSEHTYFEHISYLIKDIKKHNIELNIEELDYKEHDKVSKYFPGFLKKNVQSIIEGE